MARELKDYRDNMELLNIRYPDHEMLTIAEGDVFKLYRMPNGTVAIKKREPIMRKEASHDA